jgi:vacuolar-type H+-ATPase subunit F/Vma7
MSRLLVITRPELESGFHLAGVEAFAPTDLESVQELVLSWLETKETGLLAIDDGWVSLMETNILKNLEESTNLLFIAIPGGPALGAEASRHYQIAEMIRRAIGFHITFKSDEEQEVIC